MKRLPAFSLILIAFVSSAQNKTIDSLHLELKNYDVRKQELHKNLLPDESDSFKVNILNELSKQCCIVSDFDQAKKYAGDAMEIGLQTGYKKGILYANKAMGVIYDSQGNYPQAINSFMACLKISEEIGDKKNIGASCGNIGIIYEEQGNYPQALKNYFAALKIDEEIGNKEGIETAYNNIGIIYTHQGNYAEALKNLFACLKMSEELGDKIGVEKSHCNIGEIYRQQGKYSESLNEYFAARSAAEEIGDKELIAGIYCYIGSVYNDKGDYAKALENQLVSLNNFEELGEKNGVAMANIRIGETKLKMQNAAMAKKYLMQGYAVAREIGALDRLRDASQYLASSDSALGNFKDAYENYKLFVSYRDSLNNGEATNKMLQSKMQYEFDKKEAETRATTDAELKKQKLLRNGFVGGFAVVLLFAGVFFRQRNKTKKEKQRSDTLLLNILPAEVANEIKTTGTAKAKAFTMVTVMFTDFKDFTSLSEKISAELLVDEIHTCFSAFDYILHKYRVEKIKTIGDAYLCASGLPVSTHTHATDMLNAAIEIRNFMEERKKVKEARGEIPFELRIGIHTGPVVAGVVGVKKYAYDIWGDTVNIAARMEQNSEAGKINISGNTYDLVKDKFNCLHRGKISAKNKGEIDMYFVETA